MNDTNHIEYTKKVLEDVIIEEQRINDSLTAGVIRRRYDLNEERKYIPTLITSFDIFKRTHNGTSIDLNNMTSGYIESEIKSILLEEGYDPSLVDHTVIRPFHEGQYLFSVNVYTAIPETDQQVIKRLASELKKRSTSFKSIRAERNNLIARINRLNEQMIQVGSEIIKNDDR